MASTKLKNGKIRHEYKYPDGSTKVVVAQATKKVKIAKKLGTKARKQLSKVRAGNAKHGKKRSH